MRRGRRPDRARDRRTARWVRRAPAQWCVPRRSSVRAWRATRRLALAPPSPCLRAPERACSPTRPHRRRPARRVPPSGPCTPNRRSAVLYACRSASAPPSGLSVPSSRAAVARTTKSGSSSRCTSTARRSVAFRRASDGQHRRDHTLVLVLQHRAHAVGRQIRGERAERLGQCRANAPVAIGVHARQHRGKALLIDRRGSAQRGGAHVGPLVGQQVLDRRQSFSGPQRAECRDSFEPDIRMRRRRAGQAREGAAASVAPSCGERADRGDGQFQSGLRCRIEEREQRLDGGRVLECTEPSRGERTRVAPIRAEQLQERGRGPRIFDALQRVCDRPPRRDRLTARERPPRPAGRTP